MAPNVPAHELLHGGAAFIPALVRAIREARTSVHLETYVFATDEVGYEVLQALAAATANGATVCVVADWLGTGRNRSTQVARALQAAGVQFRSFNPWFVRGVARTHRKMCVVDSRVAFIGGINLVDDLHSAWGPETLPFPRWDFALRLEGPVVGDMQADMQAQWSRLGRLSWLSRIGLYRESLLRSGPHRQGGPVSFVCCDNLHNRLTIQATYLEAIRRARHRILLANPYFAPGRTFRDALAAAAARGVEVRLLLGVGQYRLQDAVARSYYAKLLRAGVILAEYRRTQLHAKVAVIDDDWVTIGSSNCDGLSLFVNQEANVVVRDRSLADDLARHILSGMAQSVRVDASVWRRSVWRRFKDGLAFLAYRGVMRVITWNAFQ